MGYVWFLKVILSPPKFTTKACVLFPDVWTEPPTTRVICSRSCLQSILASSSYTTINVQCILLVWPHILHCEVYTDTWVQCFHLRLSMWIQVLSKLNDILFSLMVLPAMRVFQTAQLAGLITCQTYIFLLTFSFCHEVDRFFSLPCLHVVWLFLNKS